jgi:hypothetical protein
MRRAHGVGCGTQRRSLGHRRHGSAPQRPGPRARPDRLAHRGSLGRVPARLEPELRHIDAVAAGSACSTRAHHGSRVEHHRDATARSCAVADRSHRAPRIITTFAKGTARSRVEETTHDRTRRTGYAAALAELETILGELERADVDVDVLAAPGQARCRAHRLSAATGSAAPGCTSNRSSPISTTTPPEPRHRRSQGFRRAGVVIFNHVGNIIDLDRCRR